MIFAVFIYKKIKDTHFLSSGLIWTVPVFFFLTSSILWYIKHGLEKSRHDLSAIVWVFPCKLEAGADLIQYPGIICPSMSQWEAATLLPFVCGWRFHDEWASKKGVVCQNTDSISLGVVLTVECVTLKMNTGSMCFRKMLISCRILVKYDEPFVLGDFNNHTWYICLFDKCQMCHTHFAFCYKKVNGAWR